MTTQKRPTALVVHAHPESDSFSSAQASVAIGALEAAGHHVDRLDLYADKWAPVLAREEFGPLDGPFKPQTEQMRAVREGALAPSVQEHLDRLLSADLLVLSFPMWWFSMPAILKGWVDRVFAMGAVFGGELGLFGEAAMNGRRAVLLITTGGSQASFTNGGTFGALDDFLFHIRRGMLEFVGYRVLDPVVTYGPAHMDDGERDAALEAVRQAFTLLASDSHLPAAT